MIEDIEKELIDYQAIDAEPWEEYKKRNDKQISGIVRKNFNRGITGNFNI